MESILLQAVSFCFVIILGYLMKRWNLLSKADGGVLSQIIVNITLPATIIISLAPIKVSSLFFILLFTGFFMNILTGLAGGWLSRGKESVDRKFQMYAMSGYNIGNFSLPFVQGFFPIAVPFYVCLISEIVRC